MEFCLIYDGPLSAQRAKAPHKWAIRRALEPQLRRLWQEHPLASCAESLLAFPAQPAKVSVVLEKHGQRFAPLVTSRLNLHAELSVLLFRQQPRGALIYGGDIDNRLKTLVDGLRMPRGANEGRQGTDASSDPELFFCLLEDDSLVTKITVKTEQLLKPAETDSVLAIVSVHVKKTVLTYANMGI